MKTGIWRAPHFQWEPHWHIFYVRRKPASGGNMPYAPNLLITQCPSRPFWWFLNKRPSNRMLGLVPLLSPTLAQYYHNTLVLSQLQSSFNSPIDVKRGTYRIGVRARAHWYVHKRTPTRNRYLDQRPSSHSAGYMICLRLFLFALYRSTVDELAVKSLWNDACPKYSLLSIVFGR
jgi:hypothetical protein